jgi:ATP-binding cassette subfamily B protein
VSGLAGDWSLYRRLLSRARPYAGAIAGIFALGLLASPIALLNPLPLKLVVDSVLGSHPLPGFLEPLLPRSVAGSKAGLLGFAVALLVATALLGQLRELGTSLLRTWTGEKLVLRLRSELFRCVQRLSFSANDARGTADSLYRIQYDAPAIQRVVIEGFVPFLASAVSVLAMLTVSARIDPVLALVALAVAPALSLTLALYRRRLRERSRRVKRIESSALSVVHEVLAALRVVKAFGQEEREEARFTRRAGLGLRERLRLGLVEGGFGLLVGLIMASGTALVLWIGIRHVEQGILTLGNLLLVMGYVAQLYEPLRTMSRKAASLQNHLASAERAFALLDHAPDVEERPNARPLGRAAGAISFRGVRFGYPGNPPVLRDVSLEVPAGARVGISGPTGAGKTTLVSLLTRFYDPDAGSIALDGVDLRDYRVADLRRQFGIVLQEPVLFSTSISENIAYARPEASEREIAAAAEAAGADEFIRKLPLGYATPVGERGMRLSGGERQRIALARAFLTDAPILVLDEPTSSVDPATERIILHALERLVAGRTTFTIAHRPETLAPCDLQLEIRDGRLVEAAAGSAARSGPAEGTRAAGGGRP